MKEKDEILHIKINSDEKNLIATIAAAKDISVSQFVRETLREKVAEHTAGIEAQSAEPLSAANALQ